jgi:DNA-binding Lrp family transcriptional regulator
MDLDRTDVEILRHLQNNARLSNKELADRIGLAPSTCLERVRKLERSGILLGYHAEVDPGALGIGLEAMISVKLTQHSRDLVDAFQAHAQGLSETLAVYHVAGANDFMVHVAVRDVHHLRDLALDAFTRRSEVAHVETALIFGHARNKGLPSYRFKSEDSPLTGRGDSE